VTWADELLRNVSADGGPEGEAAQDEGRRLALARVLIVKGDTPAIDRALGLLKHLLLAAEAEGRAGIHIQAMALQAMAQWQRRDVTNAMTALERALHLAETEGYIRLFADLGLPMARLLQEARSRAVMPEYVKTLLGAFGPLPSLTTPAEVTLPEPLAPREQEVLKLIAAGLTNREIAEALVISPETVKKHTGNIFAKLAVSNRTEAAARARELDLLD
jgi:LuxR family maltose regulon positive regulatory protein